MSGRCILLALAIGTTAGAALAEEQVLVSRALDFETCPATIGAMLRSLGAVEANVRTEVDTAAIYRVKLVAREANLVFRCGRSDNRIEIVRTTPGELRAAGLP